MTGSCVRFDSSGYVAFEGDGEVTLTLRRDGSLESEVDVGKYAGLRLIKTGPTFARKHKTSQTLSLRDMKCIIIE